jgi:hypothetical protein
LKKSKIVFSTREIKADELPQAFDEMIRFGKCIECSNFPHCSISPFRATTNHVIVIKLG